MEDDREGAGWQRGWNPGEAVDAGLVEGALVLDCNVIRVSGRGEAVWTTGWPEVPACGQPQLSARTSRMLGRCCEWAASALVMPHRSSRNLAKSAFCRFIIECAVLLEKTPKTGQSCA